MMYYVQMFDLCIYFLYLHIQGIVKLSHIKGVAKKGSLYLNDVFYMKYK